MSGREPSSSAPTGAPSPLIHGTAWMFVGNALYAACQWGLLVVLARLGGPELVGRLTLALAVSAPVVILSQLQIRQIVVVDALGRHAFRDYLMVRLTTTSLAMMAILAIALLGYAGDEVSAVIIVVGLAKGVESVSDVFCGVAQRHQRLDLVAKSMILRAVLGLAAFVLIIGITGRLVPGLLGLAAAWALVWLGFDRRVTRPWRAAERRVPLVGRARLHDCVRLAWLGLPLGIALALAELSANVPRYSVEWFLGIEALGTFGVLAYFVVMGGRIVSAVGQSAIPRLANHFAHQEIAPFRRLLVHFWMVAVAVGAAGVLLAASFGTEVLTLLYGSDFIVESHLFVWVMVVGLISYAVMPVGYALTAMQRFRIQPVILAVAVTANVLGCLLLVPVYGLLGAALGWLAASLCQGALGLAVLWRHLHRATKLPAAPPTPTPTTGARAIPEPAAPSASLAPEPAK